MVAHLVYRVPLNTSFTHTLTLTHSHSHSHSHFPPGAAEPKSNGKRKKKRRAGRGEKGSILINALEKEMLFWAIHGFLPKGPAGLIPTSGLHTYEHEDRSAVCAFLVPKRPHVSILL